MAYCGIDVGTQGVRVVIAEHSGAVLGEGSAALPIGHRAPGRHEQTPSTWWDALVAAVRAALAEVARSATGSGPRAIGVDAIALDATSGTVLVESAGGVANGPALMYDDARAGDQSERAAAHGHDLWSALGYRMQPSWALPKAMWLAENVGIGAGEHVVHQSDHLTRQLIGHPVDTDISNALKTGADLRDCSWPDALHADLGLPPGTFPGLTVPGRLLGRVGAEAAAATGLTEGTPVRAGMTDGCAAQIAAGALAPGRWSSALGTTLVIKGSTDALVRDRSGAVYSHRHPDGGWLPGGASSTGAGIIARSFPNASPAELSALTAQAARLGPIRGVTYPLAGDGERFPFVAPQARGFMTESATDDAHRFAALCQGVAYVERLAYQVLAHLGADTTGTVALTGGATRNSWWNQLRTDVLGRPTTIPRSDQAAFGMAILAAAEPGRLTETSARMVHVEARLQPDIERAGALQEGYALLVHDLADRGWLDEELASGVLAGTAVGHE